MTKVADHDLPPGTTGLVLHKAALYDLTVWLMTLGQERSFREKILRLARLEQGESVLDVGCGTGSLAIAAKRQVGPAGTVCGIDASPEKVFPYLVEPELLTRKGIGDDRRRVREQEGAADALQDSPQDQLRAIGGEARAHGRERKDQEAADVGALTSELIRQPPGTQDEHGRRDHVDENHPDELEQARVQASLEVWQRDDQRARVDRGEQHPQARARKCPPLVGPVVRMDANPSRSRC